MKSAILFTAVILSINAYACPDLEGRYPNCKSEIRDIRGEYVVEQFLKDNVTHYQLHYIDDETDENRSDSIKTDGSLESRKERLPIVGLKVKIDSRFRCTSDAIVSDANVYFFGALVGQFKTKIYKEGNTLFSNLDGSYLGQPLSKRIVCTQN